MPDNYAKNPIMKKIRLAVIISISLMMASVLLVVYVINKTEVARADFSLVPQWDPPLYFSSIADDQDRMLSGPLQNTPTSRLYLYEGSVSEPGPDDHFHPVRVNDDGTSVEGNSFGLDRELFSVGGERKKGMISDGLDGAYVASSKSIIFDGDNIYLARLNGNGGIIWEIGPGQLGTDTSPAWNHVVLASDGHAIMTFRDGNYVCGVKINRTTSASMWTSQVCGGQDGRRLLTGEYVHTVVSDGQGGIIILSGSGRAHRIDSAGDLAWSVDFTADPDVSVTSAFYYDGSVYMIWTEDIVPNKELFIDRVKVADGSQPWAEPYNVSNVFHNPRIVQVDNTAISLQWELSADSSNYTNRINMEDGTKVWPSDKLIYVRTPFQGIVNHFTGPQSVSYFAICEDIGNEWDCSIQGFDGAGQKIFPGNGITVDPSSEAYNQQPQFGIHNKIVGNDSLSCIGHGYGEPGGIRVAVQEYCLGSLPTVTDPICSINGGADFGLCSEAQYGNVLSHVRVSCDPGAAQPFSEGALNDVADTTWRFPYLTNQYVIYEASGYISRYDLGADKLFGTPDDGTEAEIIAQGSALVEDVTDDHVFFAGNVGAEDYIWVYNWAAGETDPGSLRVDQLDDAGFNGRYILYERFLNNPDGHMFIYDVGPDGRLGTGDDLGDTEVTDFDTIGHTDADAGELGGRYGVVRVQGGGPEDDSIFVVDLTNAEAFEISDFPQGNSLTGMRPVIYSRYVLWTARECDTCNFDIYMYDLGPDGSPDTTDDIGTVRLTTSGLTDYLPSMSGTKIVFSRYDDVDFDFFEVMVYDLGPDGLFGTADDSGDIQITDHPRFDSAPHINGNNIVWERQEEDGINTDVYISPVGAAAADIAQVQFTLNAPSGYKYEDLIASDVVGNTYTLHNPKLINEEGQWTISAICKDSASQQDTSQAQWDVGAWPFSANQKLSVYQGVIQIAQSSGDTLEIGNAGRDIASTGNIYLRPNNSLAGAFWEGTDSTTDQRLHFPYGIAGQPTILAQGSGTQNSSNGASAVASFFSGSNNNAGGSAVYGEVVSCAAAGGCAAGYFAGNNEVGLLSESSDSIIPALKVENSAGASPENNVSALFEGNFVADGDIQSEKLLFSECHWETLVWADLVCPNNGFISGYENNPPGENDRIYCCGNP
ncbi:MAG: hypothetical protein V1853_05085 [bacterium]